MDICVVGTGYVGLVTGACFAEMGNAVICVDVDQKKIDNLKQGILPIHEPGLGQMVEENYKAGRLRFTTSLPEAMKTSNLCFIAVGTPPAEDGSADLQYVLNVAKEIGQHLERYAVIVDKSTVPVGTADKVRATIQEELSARNVQVDFDVVSNPEFLKEGVAVDDFMSPDRIVIGADSERGKSVLAELYAPFVRNHPRIVYMGVRDAELTKYAANAMLATKISFMNEVANLAERLDVDIENVRLGIGSDHRIGFHFIYPGAGYGGSCFPKDVKALIGMANKAGFDPKLLQAVDDRNNEQKQVLFQKIQHHFGSSLAGKTIAVWGLAFKPGTDDMREAPSKTLIKALIAAGAKVKAHDPVAIENARGEFDPQYLENGALEFVEAQYETAIDADGLVLVTEWKPFRRPDFKVLERLMKEKVVFDGRNQYDPNKLTAAGWTYYGVGRAAKA
ncbi:UDP-glucose dehydrogenase family protein [Variovorax paradoxus]|uniref:UDP-glucose dehydrogenase family protein n=1 Tax=Variovorax paradoxus TaxID=34073 RepID=UPI0029C66B31|nr:UDP-glucose/GDP-mannose dehydrogenase family protein [Variovorax paradoxus]